MEGDRVEDERDARLSKWPLLSTFSFPLSLEPFRLNRRISDSGDGLEMRVARLRSVGFDVQVRVPSLVLLRWDFHTEESGR